MTDSRKNNVRRKSTRPYSGKNRKKPAGQPEAKTSSKYTAYIDTEFNCFDYYGQNGGVQEIIEIGLVVMRAGEFVDGFRSYCALRPGHKLSRRAEDLTGINRSDLETAPSYPEAVRDMNRFLDMYNPSQLYAYGPEDRAQMKKTAELYDMSSAELYYLSGIKDIMKELNQRLNGRKKSLQMSLKDVCSICGIDPKGIHDAYNDAIYLGKCTELILAGNFDAERVRAVAENKARVSGYRAARRFKDIRESVLLNDEELEPVRYAIDRLIREQSYPEHQLRALLDDLLAVTGRNPENEY